MTLNAISHERIAWITMIHQMTFNRTWTIWRKTFNGADLGFDVALPRL
jgi:hypothetical protein